MNTCDQIQEAGPIQPVLIKKKPQNEGASSKSTRDFNLHQQV